MTAPRDIGDYPTYNAEANTGFDNEGYVLVPANPGSADKEVTKSDSASPGGTFVGVNHHSTYNYDDTEVRQGEAVGIHQEGVVNVLVEGGTDYQFGDTLYISENNDGVANASNPGSDTEVGKVMERNDLSGEASGDFFIVKAQITGRV